MYKFIETHSHLCDEKFNSDREEIIKKIFLSGIDKIVEISCEVNNWEKSLEFCKQYPGKVYCAFGTHPEYSESLSEKELNSLRHYLLMPQTAALGEIGIDYWWDVGTRESQKKLLSQQLIISSELKKPVVFHARSGRTSDLDAYADLLDTLKVWGFNPLGKRFRGVLHCFSGNYQQAVTALDNNLAIGVNGTITYKRNNDLRDIIKKIGIKHLVLETDCPYLPPEGSRGKRNDSSFIPEIAVYAATILGLGTGQVAEITSENAKELFGI